MITKNSNNVLLDGRTDDNLKFACATDYNIAAYSLSFLVKTKTGVVDLSDYCIKTSDTDFIVDIPSSVVATLEDALKYKIGIILDENNRDFLFGGRIIIKKGILL